MCGILGVLTDGRPALPDVEPVLAALTHRGPDACAVGRWEAPGLACAIAHTRLRIIDVSPEGDQPMPNEDGTVWVAFNGEIYNHPELRARLERAGHRFRSRTDTEVLVHLYEEEDGDARRMLERVRGMFALALFDRARGRLLLARDRLGIKPMYWASVPGTVAFSSEVRALARAGRVSADPDPEALLGYLVWGVVQGPRTILAGIEELPPGSFLLAEGRRLRVERWWTPQVRPDASLVEGADRLLRAALSDATSRHLVADRPVGLFLSGGVDSAAVAKMAAREGALRALTVTFPEEPSPDEDSAGKLAREVGAVWDRVEVTGEEIAGSLPAILASMDQPTSDGVNTWIVCRAAKEAGLVVALSGLGGDELFGGYPTFRLVPRLAPGVRALGLFPRLVRSHLAAAASRRHPGGRLARVLSSAGGHASAYAAVRGLLGPAELDGPWPQTDAAGSAEREIADENRFLSPADRVMLLELDRYLRNQLLRDTDQMSMAHSLEVRVPLLDDVVVRVALALPAGVRNEEGKALLARAAGIASPLPKRPFALPFERWMRGPLRDVVREGLRSEDLPLRTLVPAALRRRVWDAWDAGRCHWSRPWALTVLRMWPVANGFRW